MIQIVVIFLLILSSIGQSLEYKCERLDENVQKLCHDTGYIYTTMLPSQNGTEYKNNIYKEISRDQSLFSNCSRLSQFMVCSKYVPKCLEKEIKRVLPCKDVCERFVWDCRAKLEQNSLKDLYSGFCQLLPDRRGNASDAGCLEPQAFQRESNRPEGSKPQTITCYCDTCGRHQHFCQTNGSCFIQSQLTKNKMTTVRTCLPPGKQHSFICKFSKNYKHARCCQADHCNKELYKRTTTPAPTTRATAKPKHHAIIVKTEKTTVMNITTPYPAVVNTEKITVMNTTKFYTVTEIVHQLTTTTRVETSPENTSTAASAKFGIWATVILGMLVILM